MAKMDYMSTQKPEIESTCDQIQDALLQTVSVAVPALQRVRNFVRGNKAAIVAEIGNDNATALQTVYTKLKEAVEAANGVVIEDLPDD